MPPRFSIWCAPGAFKESMSSRDAAAAMAHGARRACRELGVNAQVYELPLSDGGEGFVEMHTDGDPDRIALAAGVSGPLEDITVAAPFGTTPATSTEVGGCFAGGVIALTVSPLAWWFGGPIWAIACVLAGIVVGFLWDLPALLLLRPNRVDLTPRHAFAELSSVAGLHLIEPGRRNPTKTSTFGFAELIRFALAQRCETITIGVGNSATVDAGTGALAALGVRFYDENNTAIPRPAGGDLARIVRIDLTDLDQRLRDRKIAIHIACDVDNPLLGAHGAARTFAPQKGATPQQVEQLEAGMRNFVERCREAGLTPDPDAKGAGAAGGFPFGMATFLGATLYSASDEIEGIIDDCEPGWTGEPNRVLVLTGEGRLDAQSARGKLPVAVAKGAKKGVRVIALVGSAGEGADACLDPVHAARPGGQTERGLYDYRVITPADMALTEALQRGPELLEQASFEASREWLASVRA